MIPVLSRLRIDKLVQPESLAKIDKVLDRLQYAIVCHVRAGKRADQMYTREGEERPPQTAVGRELVALLDALASHVESINRTFSSNPVGPFYFVPVSFRVLEADFASAPATRVARRPHQPLPRCD